MTEIQVGVMCGDGLRYMFRLLANDAPSDVGEAAGSNPLIFDVGEGEDDWLDVYQLECVGP
jgi:hypothetical protein